MPKQLVRAVSVVALASLLLATFPVQAEVDESPLKDYHETTTSTALVGELKFYALINQRRHLEPRELLRLASVMDALAIEHAQEGNLARINSFIRQNKDELGKGRSPVERQALEIVSARGVGALMHEWAAHMRTLAYIKDSKKNSGASFLPVRLNPGSPGLLYRGSDGTMLGGPCGGNPCRAACDTFFYTAQALNVVGIVLSFFPLTAFFGATAAIAGMMTEITAKAELGC